MPLPPFKSWLQFLAWPLLLVPLLVCGGSTQKSGDQPGNLNSALTISPQNPVLYVGKTQKFTAISPWGSGATWAVVPASGGTFSDDGSFTATGVNGTYQVVAMWKNDVRYTATTSLSLVDPPKPLTTDPTILQASGGIQAAAGIQTSAVVGEVTSAKTSRDSSGSIEVRHGFAPPIAP